MGANRFVSIPPFEWVRIDEADFEVKWESTTAAQVRVQQEDADEWPTLIMLSESNGRWSVRHTG